MPKIKRELKTVVVTAKVTPTLGGKAVAKCEAKNISMSEYINQLMTKDLSKK